MPRPLLHPWLVTRHALEDVVGSEASRSTTAPHKVPARALSSPTAPDLIGGAPAVLGQRYAPTLTASHAPAAPVSEGKPPHDVPACLALQGPYGALQSVPICGAAQPDCVAACSTWQKSAMMATLLRRECCPTLCGTDVQGLLAATRTRRVIHRQSSHRRCPAQRPQVAHLRSTHDFSHLVVHARRALSRRRP